MKEPTGNNQDKYKSSLGFHHQPTREDAFKSPEDWLQDVKAVSQAEGLWRVHDGIYDLKDFVKRHPGGSFWLEATKGIDITEAFESHHISTLPEEILKKYFVRKASKPRMSPYTFEDNGFYRTLKRNVREALKTIPKRDVVINKIITDSLLTMAFVTAVLTTRFWSYTLAVISGILLASMTIASHNYYHQKDNFRMYYCNIGWMQLREWRIIHILSHHLFTNSIMDIQAYFAEPLFQLYPHSKSVWAKYASWVYGPLLFWPIIFYIAFLARLTQWMFLNRQNAFDKYDLLTLSLPATMVLLSNQSFLATIGMWCVIIAINNFWFSFIGNATTHYHPDIFMDGDKPRSKADMDWGKNQLDTVCDKYEVTGNLLLVLTNFGDHALHHLFPSLDHGILHHLYPVVQKTMEQFNLDIRIMNYSDIIFGYFRQLSREVPNPLPPERTGSHPNSC